MPGCAAAGARTGQWQEAWRRVGPRQRSVRWRVVTAGHRGGRCYVARTNNTRRAAGEDNAASPRDPHPMGRIVGFTEDSDDNGATGFRRESSVLRGAPIAPDLGADLDTGRASEIAHPDNLAIEQGERHGDRHRWPAARDCHRQRHLPRANRRARIRSQPTDLQRRGGSHVCLGTLAARQGLPLSLRHPGDRSTCLAHDADICGPLVQRPAAVAGARTTAPQRSDAQGDGQMLSLPPQVARSR